MINLSTDDEELRMKAMNELLVFLGEEFGPDAVPSVLGATRGRIIARITGCPALSGLEAGIDRVFFVIIAIRVLVARNSIVGAFGVTCP